MAKVCTAALASTCQHKPCEVQRAPLHRARALSYTATNGPRPGHRRWRLRSDRCHRAAQAGTRGRLDRSRTASASAGRVHRYQQGGASRIWRRRAVHRVGGERHRGLAALEPRSRAALPRDRFVAAAAEPARAGHVRAGQFRRRFTSWASSGAARWRRGPGAISRVERRAVQLRHLQSRRRLRRKWESDRRSGRGSEAPRRGAARGCRLRAPARRRSRNHFRWRRSDRVLLALGAWTPHALPWLAAEFHSGSGWRMRPASRRSVFPSSAPRSKAPGITAFPRIRTAEW